MTFFGQATEPVRELKKQINSARSKCTILGQLCNLIPPHLVSLLAKNHKAQKKAESFDYWSHVVALIEAARLRDQRIQNSNIGLFPVGNFHDAFGPTDPRFACPPALMPSISNREIVG